MSGPGADARILVAGHTGLVGSAIVRELRANGRERLILASRKEVDLRDAAAADRFFAESRPEYVYLAAARVGGILANDTHPADFLRDNLQIQTNVIDLAFRHKVKRLVFLASTCIYPKQCQQPMEERFLLTGAIEPTNEPYAVAKIAGIKMCQAYRKQHGADFFAVVAANSYGPGDHFDEGGHVISSLIRRFHDAKRDNLPEVAVWGTGTPRREFLYADDLAAACVFLMGQERLPDFLNVGSGNEASIAELAGIIRRVVGLSAGVRFDPTRPDGIPRRLLDGRVLSGMGWRPRVGLEDGIRKTYDWFLKSQS